MIRRRQRLESDQNLDTVEALVEFAESRGHAVLELAFSWLTASPTVASVVAGATSPEQAKANAAATGWTLSDTEVDEVEEMPPGRRG